MTRTVDLSFLNSDFDDHVDPEGKYRRHWEKLYPRDRLPYPAAPWRKVSPKYQDYLFRFQSEDLDFVIDWDELIVASWRFKRKRRFPISDVPVDSPFRARELAKTWYCFIAMFRTEPPEIEDMHIVSGYEE